MWESMKNIKSERLTDVASSLPQLLDAAYADSTLVKYKPAWIKWLIWVGGFTEVVASPADPFFVACYFNDLVASGAKQGAIILAYCAIRWGHHSAGAKDSPTEHLLLGWPLQERSV